MIKDALSGIGHLHAGVPQGSVLGSLMFLIFINDITDEIVGLGRLFADDKGSLLTAVALMSINLLEVVVVNSKSSNGH
jgi:hypothetical protein